MADKAGAATRKKILVGPDMKRMKQTFKVSCIQLSHCKIHLHMIKKF